MRDAAILAFVCALLWGCEPARFTGTDAGVRPRDAGGNFDAGLPDTGLSTRDAGLPDAGPPDAGPPDAGPPGADVDAGNWSGDSCADPIRLTLSGGSAAWSGSSVGAMHDHDGPGLCTQCRTRIDMVFAVEVPPGLTLRGNYKGLSGTMDCIALRNDCPGSTPGGYTCGPPADLSHPNDGRAFPEGGTAYFLVWMDGEKEFGVDIEAL